MAKTVMPSKSGCVQIFVSGVFKNKTPETVTAERKFEKFSDFVERKDDGTFEMKQSRKNALNTKIKRMRTSAEQYVLLAKQDGNYQCAHCPRGVFYLFKGEVAKVGTTMQGEEGRYDQNYYYRMGLLY